MRAMAQLLLAAAASGLMINPNGGLRTAGSPTLRAAKMGDVELEGMGAGDGAEHTAEEHIRKRVQIMMAVSVSKLLAELNDTGIDRAVAQRALAAMVRQGDFQELAMGKKVKRLR